MELWIRMFLLLLLGSPAACYIVNLQPLRGRKPGLIVVSLSKKSDETGAISDEDDLSLEAFQRAKEKQAEETLESEEFDGYALRDLILHKWGACYDVDFNRVDSFGFRSLYLNVLPFRLGKRPFRHASEYDYLCHLQAVVEILQEYGQLDYVLYQIAETKKKPRPGTSPLVAVPLRLDLSPEQEDSILGP